MIADVSGKCYIHCPRRDVLVASIPNNSVDYLESFFVLANHMMHVIRAISNLTLLHASVGETAQHLMERPWLFALDQFVFSVSVNKRLSLLRVRDIFTCGSSDAERMER